MKLTRKEFNKSVQVFSRLIKLHSLVLGCYEWSRKAEKFVPVKDFQERFDVVIKTAQGLKRHNPTQIVVARMAELGFDKKEKKDG